MLTVSSGWLGPETITNPAVEGALPKNNTIARIKLNARKSAFENKPRILQRPLEQSSLTFEIGRPYVQFIRAANG